MDFKMRSIANALFFFHLCMASYHEQYRVPLNKGDKWESYIFEDKEYIIQNLPASWENSNILCGGQFNGTLAVLDTKEKAEFLAEALAETQFELLSVWVGARRQSAEDPAGYRWSQRVELRRTALDVLSSEADVDKYPQWLNRTLVPVPEGGADCVALERVQHDRPVFLDLPCAILRPFACERAAMKQDLVTELRTIRCRSGNYKLFSGSMNWIEAAAYCLLHNMNLATLSSMKCLKKIGVAMLKSRPSVETAWVGARGSMGKWTWVNSGDDLFDAKRSEMEVGWPPMRDRSMVKQSGCLEIDRHAALPPVFMEARCDRRLHFVCQKEMDANDFRRSVVSTNPSAGSPSDENYYYILVKQQLYWQHAYDNCLQMNGTLAFIESSEMLTQLLLVMGETKDQSIHHIWLSGRLNMSKDVTTNTISYGWFNPTTGKRIPDHVTYGVSYAGLFMPPWFDEDFTMDSPCLNLDRQDHLQGMVYGLPCDTPQYSICLVGIHRREENLDSVTSLNTLRKSGVANMIKRHNPEETTQPPEVPITLIPVTQLV